MKTLTSGCGKFLYENNEAKIVCGSYMAGGFMLCEDCKKITDKTSPDSRGKE